MKELIKVFGEEKSNVDKLKMNYLFDEDLEVCEYVSSQLLNFDIGPIERGNVISVDELIIKSIDEFRIFGLGICTRIRRIIDETSIYCESDNIDQLITFISYKKR